PFQVALRRAEAALAKDRAQADNAWVQLRRQAPLLKQGVVSQLEVDEARTSAVAFSASVEADQQAVADARLQLGYTTIRSPLDGRTGDLLVDPGNLVKAMDSTALVVIHQLRPIFVSFSVPARYLPEIRRHQVGRALEVRANPARGREPECVGTLDFIDNAVSTTTGTILLKGRFANADGRLWPGQFVDVTLRLATQRDALVVPLAAIQTGQRGDYVFVVKRDLTVEQRTVKVARTQGETAVVAQGLKPHERVVVDGQLRLIPGARVTIKPSLRSALGSP
ncbi:MAG: efflux RND transporter periplasmic adaptor subunit, partial [Anaerolineae bacterium]